MIQVSATAKQENAGRAEQVLRQVVEEARSGPGCERYEWFHVPDTDRRFFVYAEFTSEEAFAEYRQGPVVGRIVADLIPLLETPPSFRHFSASIMEQR